MKLRNVSNDRQAWEHFARRSIWNVRSKNASQPNLRAAEMKCRATADTIYGHTIH